MNRALKERDRNVVDVIRSVKSRLTERTKVPGYTGPMTDPLAQEVIGAYSKSLAKAIEEIEKGGGKANPILDKYRFEIEYLRKFLPQKAGEDETRALVRETIASLGVSGPSAVGRVMGALMKAHKDRLDSVLTKRVVEQELA